MERCVEMISSLEPIHVPIPTLLQEVGDIVDEDTKVYKATSEELAAMEAGETKGLFAAVLLE